MDNSDKLKILKRNLNDKDLTKLVQVKYDNNRLRIVAPVETSKDSVTVVQTSGYSKSGLSKSRDKKQRREDNLRTFELDKIRSVKEIKKNG